VAESAGRRVSFSELLADAHDPRIVLRAIVRLRWLAVVGQITATAVAIHGFDLDLPLGPIGWVILATALSNLVLVADLRWGRLPPLVIPAVLLLDIFLFTAILYLTGGPENPFSSLYLIHVAMAVIVLPRAWTWGVIAAVAACYAMLFRWHWPLSSAAAPLPRKAYMVGNWVALILVSVLIAAFIEWVVRALRQREGELQTMRERAAKNEQLAALTTLAAGAAHELGSPLGTIAVVAKELELGCGPGQEFETVREDARLIRREVDRCRTILSRMRFDIGEDVSRRTTVNIREMVDRLRDNFVEAEQGRLSVRYEPGVDSVHAPPRALEQSLLVLLRNAFDASAARGGPVVLEVTRENGFVRFEIQDRGTGMSPEMVRRAGEPFYTTKEPGKGMGLGLFLVRLVAERCGARFKIQSEEGKGTRCVFELPAADDNNAAAPARN
jgi:two-component system, sensor histidine kinase RegB